MRPIAGRDVRGGSGAPDGISGQPGDADLVALCAREHGRVLGFLTVMLGDRDVAEDLAQEALVRLCQHWPRVRRMDDPTGYLFRIAGNLGRSWWRRRAVERRLGRPDRPGTATGADDQVLRDADARSLRVQVAALPPRQREAIAYRYFLDLDVAATAAAMGVTAGTVRALTSQAIAGLRAAGLAVDDDEEDSRASR